MRAICVYCGSSGGNSPRYAALAADFGRQLAHAGITLVYGGGKAGLMGTLADATLAAGGKVHGVIPRLLVEKEVAHKGLSQLEVVGDMHTRKARMFELADGFVALPGGFGTLDEIFEMLTWQQLGINVKPCAFLDCDAFYAPLMRAIDTMVAAGFLRSEYRADLWYGDDAAAMLSWMRQFKPRLPAKWTQALSEVI